MSCALKPATLETLTLSSCPLPRSLGKKQKFLNGAKSLGSISNQKGRKGLRYAKVGIMDKAVNSKIM